MGKIVKWCWALLSCIRKDGNLEETGKDLSPKCFHFFLFLWIALISGIYGFQHKMINDMLIPKITAMMIPQYSVH